MCHLVWLDTIFSNSVHCAPDITFWFIVEIYKCNSQCETSFMLHLATVLAASTNYLNARYVFNFMHPVML